MDENENYEPRTMNLRGIMERSFAEDSPALYYLTCRQAGYVPYERNRFSKYQQGMKNWGCVEEASKIPTNDRKGLSSIVGIEFDGERKSNKFDYDVFAAQIRREGGIRLDEFEDIEIKRRILREAGYSVLWGKDGEVVPIGKAKPERVGKAFRRAYNSSVRKGLLRG